MEGKARSGHIRVCHCTSLSVVDCRVDPRDPRGKKKKVRGMELISVISFILVAFVKPCEVLAPPLLTLAVISLLDQETQNPHSSTSSIIGALILGGSTSREEEV